VLTGKEMPSTSYTLRNNHKNPDEIIYIAMVEDHGQNEPEIFASRRRTRAISWAHLKADKYRIDKFKQIFKREEHDYMDHEYVEIYGEEHHDRVVVKRVILTDKVNISGEFDFKI
jgi:hypothetical protein